MTVAETFDYLPPDARAGMELVATRDDLRYGLQDAMLSADVREKLADSYGSTLAWYLGTYATESVSSVSEAAKTAKVQLGCLIDEHPADAAAIEGQLQDYHEAGGSLSEAVASTVLRFAVVGHETAAMSLGEAA